MAIRDNRIAAESIGINITKYKLLAFSVSAALAGVAGVLYAHNLATLAATPKSFGYNMSITILVFVVLGGIGNIRGSVIAGGQLSDPSSGKCCVVLVMITVCLFMRLF